MKAVCFWAFIAGLFHGVLMCLYDLLAEQEKLHAA